MVVVVVAVGLIKKSFVVNDMHYCNISTNEDEYNIYIYIYNLLYTVVNYRVR